MRDTGWARNSRTGLTTISPNSLRVSGTARHGEGMKKNEPSEIIRLLEEHRQAVARTLDEQCADVQGIAKRAADGNASNRNAAEVGKFVEPLAGFGLEALG